MPHMTSRVLASAVAALVLAGSAMAQEHGRIRPVDQGDGDRVFSDFRAGLLSAVERQDVEYVLNAVDANIDIGGYAQQLGGIDGIVGFVIAWMPDGAPIADWDLWPRLDVILRNGGRFESATQFCAPFYHTDRPGWVDADERRFAIALRPDVPVYPQPSTAQNAIGTAEEGEILEVVNPAGQAVADVARASELSFEALWYAGGPGYIDASAVQRLGGDFACFTKTERHGWQMTWFGSR